VFILKGVKVVCFDTLLEVLILKGVRGCGVWWLPLSARLVIGVRSSMGKSGSKPRQGRGWTARTPKLVIQATASGGRICGGAWGESRRPSSRGHQSRVAQVLVAMQVVMRVAEWGVGSVAGSDVERDGFSAEWAEEKDWGLKT
jgi:hypothetical protein